MVVADFVAGLVVAVHVVIVNVVAFGRGWCTVVTIDVMISGKTWSIKNVVARDSSVDNGLTVMLQVGIDGGHGL